MRTTVTGTVEVDVPLSVAYDQWTQFETFPSFLSGVDSVEQIDDRMLHWHVHVGGADREFDAQIVEQVPDEHISWESVDGVSHAGTVSFERIDGDHTRIDVRMDWEPESFVEKVGAVLQLDDAQLKADLRRFKETIEESGQESGAWRGTIGTPGRSSEHVHRDTEDAPREGSTRRPHRDDRAGYGDEGPGSYTDTEPPL